MIKATIHHPIPVGTIIRWSKTNILQGVAAVETCEGQLGNNKVWWYRLGDGTRVCEYHIDYAIKS